MGIRGILDDEVNNNSDQMWQKGIEIALIH